MTEPLYEEIDRLARDVAAEAPDVDLPRVRRRAARRRSARLTGLATAGVALVAGTGFALSHLDTSVSVDPAKPDPVVETAHPACGEQRYLFVRLMLKPVTVGAGDEWLRVAVKTADSPTVTAWVGASEAHEFSGEDAETVRAVIDRDGPSLVIADSEGTVVGYSRLAKVPGARDLHPAERLEYEGYEPFTRCPGADGPAGGAVAAGAYSLHVEGSWTLPDGEEEGDSNPAGMLLVTSEDEAAEPGPLSAGEICPWADANAAVAPLLAFDAVNGSSGVVGEPVQRELTLRNEFDAPVRVPAGHGPFLLALSEHGGGVLGFASLADPPAAVTIDPGESATYTRFGPVVACPGAPTAADGIHLAAGRYLHHAAVATDVAQHLGTEPFDTVEALIWLDLTEP